jgi:hypothetical protein
LDVCPTNGQHLLVSRRVASLFQEMHAFVALHSGCELVRLNFGQDEKVARCNWRSKSAGDLTLIHGRGMMRHKNQAGAGGERRPHIEMMSCSCKRDAV